MSLINTFTEIPAIPPEHLPVCASYLADKTFASLKEMFTSAREIQDWFTESAKVMTAINIFLPCERYRVPIGGI